jgi:hypothetical protein
VNAIIGRTLTIEDNKVPGAHPVAVINYAFWRNKLEGDSSIVGKSIKLKDQPFTLTEFSATREKFSNCWCADWSTDSYRCDPVYFKSALRSDSLGSDYHFRRHYSHCCECNPGGLSTRQDSITSGSVGRT